jgi:hypothetical protein
MMGNWRPETEITGAELPSWEHPELPYFVVVRKRFAPIVEGLLSESSIEYEGDFEVGLWIDLSQTDRFQEEYERVTEDSGEKLVEYTPALDESTLKHLRVITRHQNKSKAIDIARAWINERTNEDEIEPTLWSDIEPGDRVRIETVNITWSTESSSGDVERTEYETTGKVVDIVKPSNTDDRRIPYQIPIETPGLGDNIIVNLECRYTTHATGHLNEVSSIDEYLEHLGDKMITIRLTSDIGRVCSVERIDTHQ